jgi:hypothetical protein
MGSGSAEQKAIIAAPGWRNRFRQPSDDRIWPFGLMRARDRAFIRRPQDAMTPRGGVRRRASTRLASANRLNRCAVFLASPR